MPSAKLSVVLESVLGSAWNSDFQKAVSDIQRFEEKAQKAGAVLSAAFTLPIALLGRTAIQSGAELDGLNRSMTAIEGSAEGAAKRIKVLNEIAKLPGLNFKDAVQGDVNLRSAGLSADLAARSMSSFGNALGILGKSGALGNVNPQIQQMANKVQGFGVDLKILKEWVPQVGVALQNAFGTQSADAISQMGVTGKEVIEKLVIELEKLPKATGGIGNALENMGDAWFKFTSRIGLAIDKAIDLSGIFNTLSEAMNDLATWFENLDPGVQKMLLGFTGAAAVIGPLLLGIAAISPLLVSIGSAASIMGVALGVAFGGISIPVVAAAAAIGLAFSAIREYWGATKTALIDKAFFADMKGLFEGTLNAISNVFGAFKNLLTGNWSALWNNIKNIAILALQPVLNIAVTVFASIKQGLGSLIESAGGTKFGKDMQANAQQLFKDLDATNKLIKAKTTTFKAAPWEDESKNYDLYQKGKASKSGTAGFNKSTEKGTNYWSELQEEEAYKRMIANKIEFLNKDKDFQNKLKNQSAGTWSVVGTAIKALPTDTKASLDKFFTNVDTGLKKVSETIKNTPISRPLSEQVMAINELISQGADNALVGMAEWAGAFSVGVKSFKDLGNLLKSIFGDMMISIGKQMVVTSEAWIAFKKAMLASGAGGLAIGLGLIVAGSALKASASKGASGGYQSVPQNSVSNYQPIYTPYNAQATGGQNARISIEINQGNTITRGQDLVTSYRNTTYDQSRG